MPYAGSKIIIGLAAVNRMDYDNMIAAAAETYDSFYLYREAGILAQSEKLKTAFPSVSFLYSVKCNPNRHILGSIFGNGFGADAASAGEVLLARQGGLGQEHIFYSAPGKTQADIEETIDKAVLIADSLDEIRRIELAAEKKQLAVKIGVRINPAFSFDGDAGLPSKFGIDEEQLFPFLQTYCHPNVRITGIHVHLRSQELNAAVLVHYYGSILELADRLQRDCGMQLDYINMGSGLGIPYAEADAPLPIEALGRKTEQAIRKFRERYPGVQFLIETARYLVGNSGSYVTKVLDRKTSHGKTYLIVKNTLNGFLRPSLARLIAHCAEQPAACEPLFTKTDAFTVAALKKEPASETVTIVGNLCTAADVIAEDVEMPHLECGDLLAISNAGAYGAVLSPMQFSSQDRPAELFLKQSGELLA